MNYTTEQLLNAFEPIILAPKLIASKSGLGFEVPQYVKQASDLMLHTSIDLTKLTSALSVLDPDCDEKTWKLSRLAPLADAARHNPTLASELKALAISWSSGDLSSKPSKQWRENLNGGLTGEQAFEDEWLRFYEGEDRDIPTKIGTIFHEAKELGWKWNGAEASHFDLEVPHKIKRLDLSKAGPSILSKPPAKRDYVLDGLLVRGKPAVLAGMGGTSKTQFTIQLAACHALGKSFMGMHLTQGSSMLLLGEEDKAEIDRRLNAYMVADGMSQVEKQSISDRVAAFGLVGQDIRLTKLQGSNAETTGFVDEIIETAKEHSQKSGSTVSLIVIDHARLAAGGDLNDAAHVTCFTREISRLADATNASVMVLAHSPKSAAGRDEPSALDVAGSSALVDNARAAFMMGKPSLVEAKRLHIPNDERSKFVVFTVVKNNYGKSDVQIVMHKTESIDYQVGLLELADLNAFQMAAQKPVKTTVCDSLLAKIKSFNGALSKTKAAERYSRELNMPRREVEAAIDQMIIEGKMEVRSPSPEEKKQWGLSGNVRQVLGIIEPCT